MAGRVPDAVASDGIDKLLFSVMFMDAMILTKMEDVSRYHHRSKPVTLQKLEGEAHSIVTRIKAASKDSSLGIEYLMSEEEYYPVWERINPQIINLADLGERGGSSKPSWRLWARKVYNAGKTVVDEAGLSIQLLRKTIGPPGLNAIDVRLNQVDELLSELPGEHEGKLRDQYQENLLAIAEIERKGGDINRDTIEYFKSELRARKVTVGAISLLPIKPEIASVAHDSSPQDTSRNDPWKPTTGAVTMLLIAISFAFVILGWQASPHKPGTTDDADFWFLLQGMLMQTASIVPTLLSFWTNPVRNHQASIWIWTFIGISITCTILAPILYTMVPTEWSAFVAFFGSVALAFVILEAMLVSSVTEKKTI